MTYQDPTLAVKVGVILFGALTATFAFVSSALLIELKRVKRYLITQKELENYEYWKNRQRLGE